MLRPTLALCLLTGVVQASTLVPAGTLGSDTNWSLAGSPYLLQGQVIVCGPGNPRLTIEAGVDVRGLPGSSLAIGHPANWDADDQRGQLTALGTAEEPITFTADNGQSGGWGGLAFLASSDHNGASSLLQHCVIELAGTNLALSHTTQPALLANLELRGASQQGLSLQGVSCTPTLQNLSIHHNVEFGLLLNGCPLPVHSGLAFSGNGHDELGYTGTIAGDLTLDVAAFTLPLRFTGQTAVFGPGNPRLSLTAGSTLRFLPWASLVIGHPANWDVDDQRGQLTALGTAEEPITFTADNGLSGGWGGLAFLASSDHNGASSLLQHCVIELAGTNLALSHTAQPALLANLELRGASQQGLSLLGLSCTPVLQDLSIHHNAEFGLLLSGCPLPLHSGLAFSGNGHDELGYTGTIAGDLTLDVAAFTLPLRFTGQTAVFGPSNPRLSLTAGSTLRFLPWASLVIGHPANWDADDQRGQLSAVGTAALPITFTADNGQSGGWSGLSFLASADHNGASSLLQHCVIELAGTNLALSHTAQPALLANLELRGASQQGLSLLGLSCTPVLQDLSFHDNAEFGLLLNGCPLPVHSGLAFSGNGHDELGYTGTIAGDLTLDVAAFTLPLRFTGQTAVFGPGNPRLSLTAGSTLRFLPWASLVIGHPANWDADDQRGQLTALGTAALPINFTADNGLSGGWGGLAFLASSDHNGASSLLQHCVIELAGTNLALSHTAQPALLANLELRGASQQGLSLLGLSCTPVLQNLSIHHNAEFGLLLSGCPLPLHSGLAFSGNGHDEVGYTGTIAGDLTLDVAAFTLPLRFTGQTAVFGPSNPRLSLTAGSTLRFLPWASLAIGHPANWDADDQRGQLTALGTAALPITFTADNGQSGGWGGLAFLASSDHNGASSLLQHCVIERATTNLFLSQTQQPAVLDHLTLQLASQRGLDLSLATPLVHNCRFLDNPTALYLNNPGQTVIGDDPAWSNSFLRSDTWHLYNAGAGAVQARHNGWCTEESGTPADWIHDQLDNPSVGLVTYLPTTEVDLVRLNLEFRGAEGMLHFEWCAVVGALEYRIYRYPAWNSAAAEGVLVGSTQETWLDLALPAEHQGFYRAVAVLEASRGGACR